MVKHIVLYTLKEGVDKTEAVKLIASVLEPLVGKIPGLLLSLIHISEPTRP